MKHQIDHLKLFLVGRLRVTALFHICFLQNCELHCRTADSHNKYRISLFFKHNFLKFFLQFNLVKNFLNRNSTPTTVSQTVMPLWLRAHDANKPKSNFTHNSTIKTMDDKKHRINSFISIYTQKDCITIVNSSNTIWRIN